MASFGSISPTTPDGEGGFETILEGAGRTSSIVVPVCRDTVLQHPVELDVVEEHRASFVRVSVIAIHKREMKVRAVGIAGVAGKTQEVTLRDGAALVGGAWKERQVCGDGAVLHVRVARELAVAMVDRDRVAAARDFPPA